MPNALVIERGDSCKVRSVDLCTEKRWDRKSEARVSRVVVNNPQSSSARDRLDLKAKAAADRHERDDWERGIGLYDEG